MRQYTNIKMMRVDLRKFTCGEGRKHYHEATAQTGALRMQIDRQTANPDKYDIATEVLSSAIRVLQAVGFSQDELPKLFEQVANKRARGPLWIEPV
jgi:hypothetical protein